MLIHRNRQNDSKPKFKLTKVKDFNGYEKLVF